MNLVLNNNWYDIKQEDILLPYVHEFTQTPPHGQEVTQGPFLSKV